MTPDSTEAIVLRTTPFAEADVVVHLVTSSHGRIGAFARAARRSRRRFRGGLHPFALLRVTLAPRRSGDLWSLRDSETLDARPGIGADLHRMAAGSRLLDLLLHSLQDGEGGGIAFERIRRFLDWLDRETRGPAVLEAGLHRMELLLLGHLGLLPDLHASARSGQDAGGLPEPCWLPGVGIIDAAERLPGESASPLGGDGLAYLHAIAEGSFRRAEDHDARRRTRDALDRQWRDLLGRDLQSRPFYREIFGA
ncbi:MAG: DNA repair protein RecO [Deltaproteobacteria bacterium]|nr:MAG: DNA repair protein RecO [Deltaproteobacteria bacterium]